MNILIVEGEEFARARRVAAFAAAGHSVIGVGCPEDALYRLRRRHFDLVLLDLFAEQDPNFAMLALFAVSAPECHIMLVTRTPLYERGELFDLMPRSIGVVCGSMSDNDLIILCEEEMLRLEPQMHPGSARQHRNDGRLAMARN